MTETAGFEPSWGDDETSDAVGTGTGSGGPGGGAGDAWGDDTWDVDWNDADDTWEIDLAEPWNDGFGADPNEPPPGDEGETSVADQPWAM